VRRPGHRGAEQEGAEFIEHSRIPRCPQHPDASDVNLGRHPKLSAEDAARRRLYRARLVDQARPARGGS
jgi:hypothetical protein